MPMFPLSNKNIYYEKPSPLKLHMNFSRPLTVLSSSFIGVSDRLVCLWAETLQDSQQVSHRCFMAPCNL